MKSRFVLALLLLAAPGIAAAEPTCGPYGCKAFLVPLESGAYALQGVISFPMSQRALPAKVWVYDAQGEFRQTLSIHWSELNYFCCCPSEWHGEYADTLVFPVDPGDVLKVVVRGGDSCSTSVVVPKPGDPALLDGSTDATITQAPPDAVADPRAR